MGKYREFGGLDLPAIDKEILAFWEEEKIFEKSIEERSTDNTFVFYEGPPSANGKPGIHHVMARTVKDLFCPPILNLKFQVSNLSPLKNPSRIW